MSKKQRKNQERARKRRDGRGAWEPVEREPGEGEGRHLARQLAEVAEAAREAFEGGGMNEAETTELTSTLREMMLVASGIRDKGAYVARAVLNVRTARRANRRKRVSPQIREALAVLRVADRNWIRERVYHVGGDALVVLASDEQIDGALGATGEERWTAINRFLAALGLSKASGAALRQAVAHARRTEPVSVGERADREAAAARARRGKRIPSLPELDDDA